MPLVVSRTRLAVEESSGPWSLFKRTLTTDAFVTQSLLTTRIVQCPVLAALA